MLFCYFKNQAQVEKYLISLMRNLDSQKSNRSNRSNQSKEGLNLNEQYKWKNTISHSQLEQLKASFDVFDSQGSGTIIPQQVIPFLRQLSQQSPSIIAHKVIQSLSEVKNSIDFDQFVQLISKKMANVNTKEGVNYVFQEFVEQDSSLIKFEDLRLMAERLDDNITDEQLKQIMKVQHYNYGTSSSQEFTLQEFFQIITKKRS